MTRYPRKPDVYKPKTKPRIEKCGNHWCMEYNERGEWYPRAVCVKTWEDALRKAELCVRRGLHA